MSFCNGASIFLWDERRFEISGTVIDANLNPGITTTMKTYISYSLNELLGFNSVGWDSDDTQMIREILMIVYHSFASWILWWLQESYSDRKTLLIRRSCNINATSISIAIGWFSNTQKYIDKRIDLPIRFGSMELHEYPLLAESWTLKKYRNWKNTD